MGIVLRHFAHHAISQVVGLARFITNAAAATIKGAELEADWQPDEHWSINANATVSPIAWGMWRLAEGGRSAGDASRLVHAALDAGITLLDTADIYEFDGSGGFPTIA